MKRESKHNNGGGLSPNHNNTQIGTNVRADAPRWARFQSMLMFSALAFFAASGAHAADEVIHGHPNRGTTEVTVLLCKFSDSATPQSPADSLSYFQNMFFAENPGRSPGTGSLKNYFADISSGALNLTGSVHGWYKEPRTKVVGNARGKLVNQDCLDAAKEGGYIPPAGSIVAVILADTNPGDLGGRFLTSDINPLSYKGWILAHPNSSFATLAHELGHALDLNHSYTREPKLGDVEYGDKRDLMSNPEGNQWPAGLNGANLDRMGWLRQDQIVTVGMNGSAGGTFRLKPLYSSGAGYKVLRIPAEAGNPKHYYTVEYRTKTGWDSGISVNPNGGIVLIHETWGGPSYLLLSADVPKQICSYVCNTKMNPPCRNVCTTTTTTVPPGVPVQSVRFNGGWLFGVTSIVNGEAEISVSLPSTLVTTAKSLLGQNACLSGYLWRSADSMDYVCVAPWLLGLTISENAAAPFNVNPSGGPYGPDTCRSGYVWREAYPGDRVCVAPWSRAQAADDNKHATERVANP